MLSKFKHAESASFTPKPKNLLPTRFPLKPGLYFCCTSRVLARVSTELCRRFISWSCYDL